MNLIRLSLRTLRREWRLPELRTLGAALVLAVAALGVVATLSARVEQGVTASAAELIGGDLGVSASSPLPREFANHARAQGLAVSRIATFPSMAFASSSNQLVDVTAADRAYPLRGKLTIRKAEGSPVIDAHGPARGTVYLDHRALNDLGLTPGQSVQLGGITLRIAGQMVSQPDGGQLVAMAPVAVMNLADAQAAGLLGTGSRAGHKLLVAGAPPATKAFASWVKPKLAPGQHLLTPQSSQQRMRESFDRAGAFLRLTALLAALLAGVAIALAAQRYARRKTDEVALLRALGTPRRRVLGLLTGTLVGLAVPALLIGMGLALGLSQLAWQLAGNLLTSAPTTLPWLPTLAAAAVGLAVLAGFALPPLAHLAEVPPVAVFQRSQQRRVHRIDLLYLLPVLVATGLIWMQSGSNQLGPILAASLAGVVVVALLLSAIMLWLARRLAPNAHPGLRLGLAALSRRRGLSLVQATALSLGLTALLLLGVVAPSLLQSWRNELPADTPNWFVLNLQDNQRADFIKTLHSLGADRLNMLPLAVGKLVSINGTPVDKMHLEKGDAKHWANRQLRLSWSARLPSSNKIVAGTWQGADPSRPMVSIDERWRDMFGLKPGDHMTFQVGEATLDTEVSSVRKVDWSSFQVNFFLLLDAAHAGALPHTWIASFHLPRGQSQALSGVVRKDPNLSLIDVNALLNRVRSIIQRVTLAVRWVLGFSLLAGILVLVAALASSAREREHEAALLRTLGAHRSQLRTAAACEFAMLGLIAGATAALGAAGAGTWLARRVFHIEHFVPPLLPLLATAAGAAVIVMLIGLAGTRRVIRSSPLLLLRRG
ncbi:FtsX-like permease family protein [Oleiagrimonas sp.]|jgi:putative ABC transport system permease protein|uniref:ABC transporter permease n=1 Tax=Oleiagrimonas sp. TaxID=2010330 RepID=UPI002608D76B|nr:FtsX-like permease family protein [Oleiagrimonas sp.]MDA3914671.1 ABC transporter permease [Oleiagrimonas sp.]